MMRRLALCKASHQLAVQPALHFSRHSASLALCCAVRAQHCAAVRHDDSTTWPEHWTAVDIEGLLRGNLATSRLAPNYGSLATLHRLGDRKSLNLLLREYVRPAAPQEVDLEKFLATHVNNVIDSAAMPLQERNSALDAMSRALSPAIGSELRNIAFCSSPRGSGKTQFLKHFVFTKRAEAMKCGRVIVRCCDKTAHETKDKSRPSWIAQVLQAQHSLTANSIDDGLCELIRTHVECVTGTQQTSSNYRDPHTAYATWMSETARHFNIPKDKSNVDPLIILDTCEILSEHDHKSLVHKHSGKP
ncbi:Bodo-specific multi-copy gene family, putative, partial [Bodo saltans]